MPQFDLPRRGSGRTQSPTVYLVRYVHKYVANTAGFPFVEQGIPLCVARSTWIAQRRRPLVSEMKRCLAYFAIQTSRKRINFFLLVQRRIKINELVANKIKWQKMLKLWRRDSFTYCYLLRFHAPSTTAVQCKIYDIRCFFFTLA